MCHSLSIGLRVRLVATRDGGLSCRTAARWLWHAIRKGPDAETLGQSEQVTVATDANNKRFESGVACLTRAVQSPAVTAEAEPHQHRS
jgi:hypothetical protein